MQHCAVSNIPNYGQVWEFIPITNFNIIAKVGKGGFGEVFKAQWINKGPIDRWNIEEKSWLRDDPPNFVALKVCNSWEIFINEASTKIKFSYKTLED